MVLVEEGGPLVMLSLSAQVVDLRGVHGYAPSVHGALKPFPHIGREAIRSPWVGWRSKFCVARRLGLCGGIIRQPTKYKFCRHGDCSLCQELRVAYLPRFLDLFLSSPTTLI
jgi:hypothetical protein